MRSTALLPVVLLALLAGCVDSNPPAAGGPEAAPPPPGFVVSAPAVAVARCHFRDCFEPTVAVDPSMRLFAADGRVSAVGVSLDQGATWTPRAPPPPRVQGSVARDVLLQVSPAGRLYYSAIVTVSPLDVPIAPGVAVAIQVAWSDDGAETWGGNFEFPVAAETAVPDRQWLAFGPRGETYLSYARSDSVWIARSDDGGTTWGAWVKVAQEAGYSGSSAGPPVVDSRGRVFIAQCGTTLDAQGRSGTSVFVSEDGGATFVRRAATAYCGPTFPMLSVGPGDWILLATVTGGWLRLAASMDHGATFSEPVIWSKSADAAPWPMAQSSGHAMVAWFGTDGGIELRLSLGEVEEPDGVTTVGVASPGGALPARFAARTDFAQAAKMPDGRVALAWVEGNQVKAAVVTALG